MKTSIVYPVVALMAGAGCGLWLNHSGTEAERQPLALFQAKEQALKQAQLVARLRKLDANGNVDYKALREDPVLSLKVLLKNKTLPLRDDNLYSVLREFFSRDPTAVFSLSSDDPVLADFLAKLSLRDYAKKDPQAALAIWREHRAKLSKEAIREIAAGWAEKQPQAAMEHGLNLPDELDRRAFLKVVVSEWSGNNPQDFLKWALAHPDAADPYMEDVRLWNADLPLDLVVGVSQQFASEFSEDDWSLAIARHLRSGRHDDNVETWVAQITDPKWSNIAWRGVAMGHTDRNEFSKAQAAIARIEAPRARIAATSHLAAVMSLTDMQAAAHYAHSLPDEKGREFALESIVKTLIERRPFDAVQLLLSGPQWLDKNTSKDLANHWSSLAPVSAYVWASSLPAQEQRHEICGLIGRGLLSDWPLMPEIMLPQMPIGPDRDVLVEVMRAGYLGSYLAEDRDALEVLRYHSPGKVRDNQVAADFLRWFNKLPREAEYWLQQSPFSKQLVNDAVKNELDALRSSRDEQQRMTGYFGSIQIDIPNDYGVHIYW